MKMGLMICFEVSAHLLGAELELDEDADLLAQPGGKFIRCAFGLLALPARLLGSSSMISTVLSLMALDFPADGAFVATKLSGDLRG